LFSTLAWSNLDYTSVAWNPLTFMDSSTLEKLKESLHPIAKANFVNGICYNKYEGIVARLNLSTLHSR
jgi:hypothetical protein